MKKIVTILMLCFGGILSAQSYHIGDLYTAPDGSQGIVFYLFPDNSGGWVVALNDVSSGCAWGTNDDISGLENLNPAAAQGLQVDTAGYSNTQIIRAFQNNNTTYAAGQVDFNHGWVLPSTAQLTILFAQIPFITSAITAAGGTEMTTDGYWSSTEFSDSQAWRMRFGDGYLQVAGKSSSFRVRAVRSFSYSGVQAQTLSYLWNTGATTSAIAVSPVQTTTYTVTVSMSGGNSGTAQQTVVVNTASNTETTVSACGSYEWNGQTYTESGDYTVVYPGPGGCDSVTTLHLTISDQPEAIITSSAETICASGEVTLDVTLSSMHIPYVNIGDILCTDNSIVKPSDWPVEGKTAMGIVFYVDNTGEHGWVVHLQDQGMNIAWSVNNVDIPSLTNYYSITYSVLSDLDGYANTQKIRAYGDASTFPAAYSVDFNNGWYLPAIGQMRLLYSELITINNSLQKVGGTQFPLNSNFFYWTSTEYDSGNAWNMNGYGSIGYTSKVFNERIRSVRSF